MPARIRLLEEGLGVTLFERNSRGVARRARAAFRRAARGGRRARCRRFISKMR
jgi:DNA-binding transcriptional LysR family regulator